MILTYHELSPEPVPYLYSSTCAQLARHLEFAAGARGVAITWDDGHRSQYEYGFPLLERYSCRSLFFVTAGWTGIRAKYMDWPHLRELADHGHEVQSHGWSHRFLTSLSPADLTEELNRSKKHLEDRLGTEVDAISMPGGRWNDRVLEHCAASGYRRVYVSTPWLAKRTGGIELYGRLMVTKSMSGRDLARLVEPGRTTILLRRLRMLSVNAARTVLGDARYQRLWRSIAHHHE